MPKSKLGGTSAQRVRYQKEIDEGDRGPRVGSGGESGKRELLEATGYQELRKIASKLEISVGSSPKKTELIEALLEV